MIRLSGESLTGLIEVTYEYQRYSVFERDLPLRAERIRNKPQPRNIEPLGRAFAGDQPVQP
jgi:hypothetical protein